MNDRFQHCVSDAEATNRQTRSYIGIAVISFQIKSCTMLCCLADDRNPQWEEIVSNFEITNKRIFRIAGRMFKPDRCRLTDKRFEALMFINCNIDFKKCLVLLNQYLKCLLQWSN